MEIKIRFNCINLRWLDARDFLLASLSNFYLNDYFHVYIPAANKLVDL